MLYLFLSSINLNILLFDLHFFNFFQNWHIRVLVFIHMAKAYLSFGFHKSVGMPKMDLETTSSFFNLTIGDIQLMNKGVPWRGGQTKDYK